MELWVWLLISLSSFLFQTLAIAAEYHLPIVRRNGRFSRHEPANLTDLSVILAEVEGRYANTYRDIDKNRLVRRWKASDGVVEDTGLLIPLAYQQPWFAAIDVGDPPQTIKFDLDMLSPDFYSVMTTSGKGSRLDTFLSKTHVNGRDYVHPLCMNPTDVFHLDRTSTIDGLRLTLPICHPPKTSTLTLLPSGNVIGLSPPGSLSRFPAASLVEQLRNQETINEKIWSITLLDSESGILSLGSTIARQAEAAKIRSELELENFGTPDITAEWIQRELEKKLKFAMPPLVPISDHFKWVDVQGASGWWTALMAGVWVNGAKVLKNQPVLFDVQNPFILAPPLAVSRLYESIGAASRLPPPHDRFFKFPCLNKPNIAFELGGWNFPVMCNEGSRADGLFGPAGGAFSLGKISVGTGYCVGRVVETRMGLNATWSRSGVQDTWVLGEPFFKGLGVNFDVDGGRIGFRSY